MSRKNKGQLSGLVEVNVKNTQKQKNKTIEYIQILYCVFLKKVVKH